jgi:hypothetical protein
VIDHQDAPPARSQLDESLGLVRRGREWLLDQHMLIGLESLPRQLEVRARWSCNDHHIDAGIMDNVAVVSRSFYRRVPASNEVKAIRPEITHRYDGCAGDIGEVAD